MKFFDKYLFWDSNVILMVKKKFKIFATNGEDIWELFFITQNKKGDFYFGSSLNGIITKFSRHVSGKYHCKSDFAGYYQDLGKRANLHEFEGFESLTCHAFSVADFEKWVPFKSYSGSKINGSAFIDIRNYAELININVFLLEPTKTEELSGISSHFENGMIIIFTKTNPWIILAVYEPMNFYK